VFFKEYDQGHGGPNKNFTALLRKFNISLYFFYMPYLVYQSISIMIGFMCFPFSLKHSFQSAESIRFVTKTSLKRSNIPWQAKPNASCTTTKYSELVEQTAYAHVCVCVCLCVCACTLVAVTGDIQAL
jgi:hypothetical protein